MSYINVKGRGLKFNQMAIIILAQKVDPDNYSASSSYAACYGGLKANAYVKGEELDMTFEQVCDWVDELTPEELTKIDVVLNESLAYKKIIEQAPEMASEKKSKPRKSTQSNALK